MLPPAAFTDEAVLEWEIDNIFDGWICLGHVSAVAETGSFLMREIGDHERLRLDAVRTARSGRF